MLTMFVFVLAYLLGRYSRNLSSRLETLAESYARELPAVWIYNLTVDTSVRPSWCIPGEYLIRDSGRLYNVRLSTYARYLMGETATAVLLRPAVVRESYTAYTPNGKAYSRTRSVRVAHVTLDTRGVQPLNAWGTYHWDAEVLEPYHSMIAA